MMHGSVCSILSSWPPRWVEDVQDSLAPRIQRLATAVSQPYDSPALYLSYCLYAAAALLLPEYHSKVDDIIDMCKRIASYGSLNCV